MSRCDCCEREVHSISIDSLYGVCHPCAFEASLGAFPCNHGATRCAWQDGQGSRCVLSEGHDGECSWEAPSQEPKR